MRFFAGLLAQPFVGGGLAFLIFPVLLLDPGGHTLAGTVEGDAIGAARSVAIGAGIVAFVVTLVGALPTAVWLAKRRPVSLRESVFWGLGFGNIPVMVGTILAGSYGAQGFLRGVAFSSVLAVACAATFWIIALRKHDVS